MTLLDKKYIHSFEQCYALYALNLKALKYITEAVATIFKSKLPRYTLQRKPCICTQGSAFLSPCERSQMADLYSSAETGVSAGT